MGTGLVLERFELEGANVFCARLIGVNGPEESLDNAHRLCDRIEAEGRDGVILDYRQCNLAHTLEEYGRVADVFLSRLPRHVRFAYVYAPGNMMHALYITRVMNKGGINARAFSAWEEAESFARGKDAAV
jgi:hypothetical protein